MGLADDYARQFQWRDWQTVLNALPSLHGQTVMDLGCGIGDLAAELAGRGAYVIGLDINEELLQRARSRQLPNVEFRALDLRGNLDLGIHVDGIWCSFAAAYFIDFSDALISWSKDLKPGGWIALTEIDDLFGHEPLSASTTARLTAYYDDALAANRYDFRAGRKLKHHLENAGFVVTRSLTIRDRELSFSGPADACMVAAWRARWERMPVLKQFLGPEFNPVRDE